VLPRRGFSDAGIAAVVGGLALLAIVLAVAAVKGGDVLQQDDGGATTGIPTFTLPAADSLTLTVPPTDTLPLPGVVTTDTAAVPTDSIEVFTETSSTVPPITETSGGETTVAPPESVTAPAATLQIG
jgi:hypothetical protein